jgi:serine protease Do
MNQRKINIAVLTVLLGAFAFSEVAISAENDNALEDLRKMSKAFSVVAQQAVPAVISIQVEKTIATGSSRSGSPFDEDFFERFFGRGYRHRAPRKQVGQGSGFIISSDGYILTNNHVVGEADKITVTLADGRKFEDAKVIGSDPDSEVAVIKIDAEDLPVIELGDSDELGVGEWVIAVGNPFGLTETVTVGVVSAKGRSGFGITNYENFIQTDAAINPGNSGGPLLSLDGKAIGINTFIVSQSGGYMGIGFAIPINMAKNVKEQLIESGKVTRGFIGVAPSSEGLTPELAKAFGLENNNGALIAEVIPESPAEKAGIEPGDIVLKIDNKDIKDWNMFRNHISMLEPGTKVNLSIFRDGKHKEIKVTVGDREKDNLLANVSEIAQKLGLQVQDLTEALARRFGYEPDSGVIVSEVETGSAAGRAGIEPGMLILSVNRRYVSSVKEFDEALQDSARTGWALLLVKHNRIAEFVALPLN